MIKNERAFTLIEMLIVLLIISVLIILIVPNLGGRSAEVNDKGCEALITVVQTQVDAYYVENKGYPSNLNQLVTEGYIKDDQKKCPSNKSLTINNNNEVVIATD